MQISQLYTSYQFKKDHHAGNMEIEMKQGYRLRKISKLKMKKKNGFIV